MPSAITALCAQKMVAVGDSKGNLKLLKNGVVLRSCNVGAGVRSLRLIKDGVLVGCSDDLVRCYDYVNNSVTRFKYHSAAVTAISFCGTSILSASENGSFKVFDVARQSVILSAVYKQAICNIEVVSDNEVLLGDGITIYLVDLADLSVIRSVEARHQKLLFRRNKVIYSLNNELFLADLKLKVLDNFEFSHNIADFDVKRKKIFVALQNGAIYTTGGIPQDRRYDDTPSLEDFNDEESIFYKEKMPEITVIDSRGERYPKLTKMMRNHEYRKATLYILENPEHIHQVFKYYTEKNIWPQILNDEKISRTLFAFLVENFEKYLFCSLQVLINMVSKYDFKNLNALKNKIDKKEEVSGLKLEIVGFIETMFEENGIDMN